MRERIKRITMYAPKDFGGHETALERLAQPDRDLIKTCDDGKIAVFPAAGGEQLDEEERAIIYRLLGYQVPDADTPWIVKRAGLVGGRASIAGTRSPVWHVVNARRQGASDSELRGQFGFSDVQLTQVFIYYERHREEIDQDIFENEYADVLGGAV